MGESELDPLAILVSMGLTTPAKVARVTGGADTAIWRVEHGGTNYALRVFRPEQAETCAIEQTAMAAASAAGVPVPHVYANTVWHERPALLLSWCAGRTLEAALLRQPRRVFALGRAFGRMQANINRIAATSERANVWIDWLGPEDADLRAYLHRIPLLDSSLLHLDYHPLNVLVSGSRISCVLDWANVKAGDRRADFARTVTILRLAPSASDLPSWVRQLGPRLLEFAWRNGYEQANGRPLPNMAPFYAWAGAAMIPEYTPRRGRLGVTEWHLVRMRRWADYWKGKAGITQTA